MKQSPSGTASPDRSPRAQTVGLLLALAVVLAFAGSAIFGLRRSAAERQIEPVAVDPAPSAAPAARGRVEVLNGAGKSGLARFATDKLRAAGFDVVQFGNARRQTDTSAVLDRVGKPALAAAVAAALGIAKVAVRPDSTRLVDATVVLGKDWLARADSTIRSEPPDSL